MMDARDLRNILDCIGDHPALDGHVTVTVNDHTSGGHRRKLHCNLTDLDSVTDYGIVLGAEVIGEDTEQCPGARS